MKCTIPEISWHNREPVLSVDINPISNEFYKLATGGGDGHVLIWQMILSDNGAIKQEVISDLRRHQKAVNTVRWSPSGQYLATADDDANIIIWQQKTDNIPLLEGDTEDKEIWLVHKVLRCHKEDIYDLCWSVNGLKLLSGSVDNTAILWDLSKWKMEHILSDHKGFVQGVAWDPKNQLIATISTDRICRIFDTSGKHIKARIHKGQVPVQSDHYLYKKNVKYFHDDTFKSFYRRLQFTPDGSLLVVPSGHIEVDDCKKILNASLIFTMDNLAEPAALLPLPKQCSTVIRCCPLLFELHGDGPDPIINLPYRMIIAIGTDHDVILYDTQQCVPFARFQEIHYTRLTDLTWSSDGLLLIASSTDGFCALITFDVAELGTPYLKHDEISEVNSMDINTPEKIIVKEKIDENIEINNKSNKRKKDIENDVEPVKKKPSFIEQWALKTSKRTKLEKNKLPIKVKEDTEVIEITDDDPPKDIIKQEINKLIPRRATTSQHRLIEIIDENTPKDLPKTKQEVNKLIPRRTTSQETKDNKNNDDSFAKPIVPSKTKSQGLTEISNDDTSKQASKKIKQEINKLIPRRAASQQMKNDGKKNDDPIAKSIVPKIPTPRLTESINDSPKEINKLIPRRAISRQIKDDAPKELSNEVKQDINVLIPRRVTTSQQIENKGKTNDDLVPKLTTPRRACEQIENKNKDDTIAKPITSRRSTSEQIEYDFKSNDSSNVEPSPNRTSPQSENDSKRNDDLIAKP